MLKVLKILFTKSLWSAIATCVIINYLKTLRLFVFLFWFGERRNVLKEETIQNGEGGRAKPPQKHQCSQNIPRENIKENNQCLIKKTHKRKAITAKTN